MSATYSNITDIVKAQGFDDDDQVLLLIENNGQEQGVNEYGDRFYTGGSVEY